MTAGDRRSAAGGCRVCYLRAATSGFTLSSAFALAMAETAARIDQAFLDAGSWDIEIADTGRRTYEPAPAWGL